MEKPQNDPCNKAHAGGCQRDLACPAIREECRMRDEVNVTVVDAEMAIRVHGWTESEAYTDLHKCGPRRHKSCAFLSVAVSVLNQPDLCVHFISQLTAILEEEKDDEGDDETEKFNYNILDIYI